MENAKAPFDFAQGRQNKPKREITITKSAQETKQFGQKFAKGLRAGQVVGLIGELGSGKTTFVQGVAQGLGIKEKIQSPTFVLLKQYAVDRRRSTVDRLVHIDLYRLRSAEDALSIGITDYLGKPDTICVIEWAEKITKILGKVRHKVIYINFEHIDENSRKIKISFNH